MIGLHGKWVTLLNTSSGLSKDAIVAMLAVGLLLSALEGIEMLFRHKVAFLHLLDRLLPNTVRRRHLVVRRTLGGGGGGVCGGVGEKGGLCEA